MLKPPAKTYEGGCTGPPVFAGGHVKTPAIKNTLFFEADILNVRQRKSANVRQRKSAFSLVATK